MQNNDAQITQLLTTIETKKNQIGTKPKALLKSNGILKFDDGTHVNINTINDTERCLDIVSTLLSKQNFRKNAATLLDIPYVANNVEDYLEDFKLRTKQIVWDNENKKLALLEQKLKDLRSEDAKTSDTLNDILKALK